MDNQEFFEEVILEFFQDPDIRERSFYPAFRRSWTYAFRTALESTENAFDPESDEVILMKRRINEVDFTFHLSQKKMAEWYQMEQKRHKHIVFLPKRFRRDYHGVITFDKAPCSYDASLPEPALEEKDRNIFAAALPGFPPELMIVYGNKWVNRRFNPFLQRSISLYWIQTDYVPAFLPNSFELCLYLFLMDYCIIKEDHGTVKDADFSRILHIFRPSPMLQVRKLLEA